MRVLLLVLFLSGCQSMGIIPTQPSDLSPEQIKALKDAGQDVYSCFTLAGGPPIGGRLTHIVVPTGKSGVTFGDTCVIRNP